MAPEIKTSDFKKSTMIAISALIAGLNQRLIAKNHLLLSAKLSNQKK